MHQSITLKEEGLILYARTNNSCVIVCDKDFKEFTLWAYYAGYTLRHGGHQYEFCSTVTESWATMWREKNLKNGKRVAFNGNIY